MSEDRTGWPRQFGLRARRFGGLVMYDVVLRKPFRETTELARQDAWQHLDEVAASERERLKSDPAALGELVLEVARSKPHEGASDLVAAILERVCLHCGLPHPHLEEGAPSGAWVSKCQCWNDE